LRCGLPRSLAGHFAPIAHNHVVQQDASRTIHKHERLLARVIPRALHKILWAAMVGEESFAIIGPRAIENVRLAVRRGVSYQPGNKTPSMAVHRCKEPPEVGKSCCRDAAEEPRMNDLWTQLCALATTEKSMPPGKRAIVTSGSDGAHPGKKAPICLGSSS
jgi:hypothetical protein